MPVRVDSEDRVVSDDRSRIGTPDAGAALPCPTRRCLKLHCDEGVEMGHTEPMLATALGSLLTIGTVTALAWDWWRHPTL